MKSIKKLLAVVLSLAMVLGSLTVTALGAETEISDLAGLTSALTDGGEYKLTADISLGKSTMTEVAAGVNVTLNLNGHKITRTTGGVVLTNNGTVTIKDTSTNADGWIGFSSTSNSTSTNTLINNKGTMTLMSGGFKQMKSTGDTATVILTTGTFNMTGGFITGIVTTNRRVVQAGTNGVFNFSGGEIYGNTVGTGADIYNYAGTVNISGDAKLKGILGVANGKTASVTGGMFSEIVSVWVPQTHEQKELTTEEKTANPGYNYKVQEVQVTKTVEVTIDGDTTGYADLAAATTAISEMDNVDVTATIKLLDNQTVSTRLNPRPKTSNNSNKRNLTFNLNGKSITFEGSEGQLIQINNKSSYTFSNGTINTGSKRLLGSAGESSKGSTIVLDNITWNTTATAWQYGAQTINIITGIFKLDPTDYTTNIVTLNDGTYTVTPAAETASVVVDGGAAQSMSYDAAMAAAAACEESATVTLTADSVKRGKVTSIDEGKSVTLDLAGYDLTNVYSGSTGTNARYFTVAGTLTITDSVGNGSVTGNGGMTTTKGCITYAEATGTINISGGAFIEGEAQTVTENAAFTRATGGTYNVTGGWYTENSYCSTYKAAGYTKITVTDDSKAATPITVTNTTKTIVYNKNGGSGNDIPSQTYAYVDGYSTLLSTKSLTFTKTGCTCVGWSTNDKADPEGPEIIGGGTPVNFADSTLYPGETVNLFAIFKTVDPADWVCVDTDTIGTAGLAGYADLASAFVGSTKITLIKNVNDRASIDVVGDRELNLNGYNITGTTEESAEKGSSIVVKTAGGALSIYNKDAGTITVLGTDYKFGGDGTVSGFAQKTGGAIDVVGSVGASVKIYGGTFKGYANQNGRVLVCTGVGKAYIYGGTFIPLNSTDDPESTVSALYADTGKIFVMPTTQSDVKIQGVMAKNTGSIGIVGGYFSDLQTAATIGTYDETNDRVQKDDTKALTTNTGDATYPYSVGEIPWNVTYDYNGGSAPEVANPAIVSKTDSSVITLNEATPATGYNFVKWTDENGDKVETLQGINMSADLTLTANYEKATYTITYTNVPSGVTNTNPTSYTISDAVSLTALSDCHFRKWVVEGTETQGWKAGKTGDVTVECVQWPSHSITYKNLYEATAPSQTTFYEDEAVTLENIDDRDNYVFNGWHTESNTGPAITGWAAGEKTADVEVYAGWTSKVAEVTIGETTTAYTSLSKAVEATLAASEQAVTLKLIKSQTITARINLRNPDSTADTTARNITIDLNGNTLTKGAEINGFFFINAQATVTVTGGTLDCGEKSGQYFAGNNGSQYYVTDGTFIGGDSMRGTAKTAVAISGGTWNIDPTDYVDASAGLYVNTQTAGQYKVVTAAATITNTSGTKAYRTLKTAPDALFDDLADGDAIKLFKDQTGTKTFSEEITFTVDKNGKTYDLDTAFTAGDGYEKSITEDAGIFTVAITKANLPATLEGSISSVLGFTYRVTLKDTPSHKPEMKYIDPGSGNEMKVEGEKQGETLQYTFAITNIYINHVADEIEATVYDGNTELAKYDYSTLDYYDQVFGQTGTTDVQKTLIANTIKYGYELQKYAVATSQANPGTEFEYNAGKYDASRNKDEAPLATTPAKGSERSLLTGASLDVSKEAAIKFILGKEDSTELTIPKDYSYAIYKNGRETQPIETGTLDKDYNYYAVRINNINPTDYDATYTLVVKNASGNEVIEATTGVNAYCYKIANPKTGTAAENIIALSQAIYGFGLAFEQNVN